jgi:hypothetical protein
LRADAHAQYLREYAKRKVVHNKLIELQGKELQSNALHNFRKAAVYLMSVVSALRPQATSGSLPGRGPW